MDMGILYKLLDSTANGCKILGIIYTISTGNDPEGTRTSLLSAFGNIEYFITINKREFFYTGMIAD